MNFPKKPTMYTTMAKPNENVCWRPTRNSNLRKYPFDFAMENGLSTVHRFLVELFVDNDLTMRQGVRFVCGCSSRSKEPL